MMNNFERFHFREIKRRTEELERQKRQNNNNGDWTASWLQATREVKEQIIRRPLQS